MKKITILAIIILLASPVLAQESVSLEVSIPKTYESVLAGENLWFTTKILGMENGKIIELNYEILDSENKLAVSKFDFVETGTHEAFTGYMNVPESLEKGIYTLKISLMNAEDEIHFNVIDEKTKNQEVIENSLFDIVVDIPKSYRKLEAGEEIISSIKLINLGSSGRVDVFLDYWIVDSKEDIVLKKTETVAIETQANFVRTFDLPEDLKPGQYKLYAKITYADGKFADGEHSFEIIEKQVVPTSVYYVVSSIIILAIIIIVLIKSKPLIEKLEIKAKVSRIVKKKMKKQK